MKKKTLFMTIGILSFLGLCAQPDAIIKQSRTTYTIYNTSKFEITEAYEVLVNNKKGLRHAMFVDYHDKFKSIRQVKIVVKDKDGKKIKTLDKSDAVDIKFSNNNEIDDSRMLYVDPKYKQYPFSVVISSKSVYNGFLSLPSWIPRYAYNLEVKQAELVLKYPTAYNINLLEEYILGPQKGSKKETHLGVETTFQELKWEAHNLAAVSENVNFKTFYAENPKVIMSPAAFKLDGLDGSLDSWRDFGNWFLKLNENRDQLSVETKAMLDSLKNEAEPRQLVGNIYKYMQDNTRYISIQLGIGGFQTIPSDVVEETGYGDCKGLTNYMKSMLSYVGIPANYILVRAGDDVPEVNSSFPSNQFNHVFLGVPMEKDTVLLECTSQMIPADYVGTFTDDRNVLWVQSGNSEIIRSRKYDEKDNVQITTGEVVIDQDGNAIVNASMSNAGVFFDDMRRFEHVSNEDAKQYYSEKFPYKDFNINELAYARDHRDAAVFDLNFDLAINKVARMTSEKMLIPVNLWLPIDEYLYNDRRSSSVEIKRAFTLKSQFDLAIPDNFWLKKLPESVKIESQFGDYFFTVDQSEGRFIITREVVFKKGFYEGETYDLFNRHFQKIKRSDNTKLVLDSKT
jgi:hypothetical protein